MSQNSPLRISFIESASRTHTLPEATVEVAFVGRSNVGKSSLINAIANQKQLARVSNTPGRTQLINLFSLDEGDGKGTLVDLPGYGYAKAAKSVRNDWPAMIEGYLLERDYLVMVFILVDGDRPDQARSADARLAPLQRRPTHRGSDEARQGAVI